MSVFRSLYHVVGLLYDYLLPLLLHRPGAPCCESSLCRPAGNGKSGGPDILQNNLEDIQQFSSILPPGWKPKKPSRRSQQRKAKRKRWKELLADERRDRFILNEATTKLSKYKREQEELFGFCANPNLPLWKNKIDYINQLTIDQINAEPSNLTCHNYCDELAPPPGTKRLLGKGLKYCVKYPVPTNDINLSLSRFENDVLRRIVTFLGQEDDDNYIPELYIKSGWPFKQVDDEIENALSKFRAEVERNQRQYRRQQSTNLTPLQWRLLKDFKKNDYYTVIEADKNLGACILRLSTYTERGIKEHLGNTSVYKRLSVEEMRGRMQS
eukprot:scaffold33693_cov154-Skeletonema_dohrnii-CCMP3373.AAC.1